MDVAVIGCGYVGLVTATCLASIGHTVRGVEKDRRKLSSLLEGHCPIFEPGLASLMQEQIAAGKGKYAIVVSRFNEFITSKLLEGAIDQP